MTAAWWGCLPASLERARRSMRSSRERMNTGWCISTSTQPILCIRCRSGLRNAGLSEGARDFRRCARPEGAYEGGGAMEEGQEVSNEEVLLRKGEMLEDYAAAKTKLHRLQDAARTEGKALNGLVEYLKRGGGCRQDAMTLESYLTYTLANLIRDMCAVVIELHALSRSP